MKFVDIIKKYLISQAEEKEEKRIARENTAAKRKEELLNLSKGINLPSLKEQIILPKNEVCHYRCIAWYETKMMNEKHVEGRSGVSIRVTKGFSVKIGHSKSREVEKEVKSKDRGQLFITNKGVIFTGQKKKFNVTYPKLIAIKPYNDGFELQTENTSYAIFIKGVEENKYINAILNGVFSHIII